LFFTVRAARPLLARLCCRGVLQRQQHVACRDAVTDGGQGQQVMQGCAHQCRVMAPPPGHQRQFLPLLAHSNDTALAMSRKSSVRTVRTSLS